MCVLLYWRGGCGRERRRPGGRLYELCVGMKVFLEGKEEREEFEASPQSRMLHSSQGMAPLHAPDILGQNASTAAFSVDGHSLHHR